EPAESPVALAGAEPMRELPRAGVLEAGAGGRVCPRCSSRTLHRRDGCWICTACGYSKCS
ncbi:MAG TPA: hypothetical protein VG758_04485, partial [Hyphomicrobiaceae bacterium]|nr:hypothetical protein [Hyphomicrobiaceae bacterium]